MLAAFTAWAGKAKVLAFTLVASHAEFPLFVDQFADFLVSAVRLAATVIAFRLTVAVPQYKAEQSRAGGKRGEMGSAVAMHSIHP